MSGWQAHFISLFPDMFPGSLGHSLAGRALQSGLWHCTAHDLRDFGEGKHKNVDDTPAGGGAGMVLRADIAAAAIDAVRAQAPDMPLLMPSPRGAPFTQQMAAKLAEGKGAVFFCNRFEGIDARVVEARAAIEVSLGDYVLSGGEPAALAMTDAVVRLLPGVMGAAASAHEESFADGLLEYPHYTRPAEWEGRAIPEILLSGDHGKIAEWRKQQTHEITKTRRPDLWAQWRKKNQPE